MSNDIKKYKNLIESVQQGNVTDELFEFKLFKNIKNKYQTLQREISHQNATGLKKGEYTTSIELSKFITRWVEQGIDYDYFIQVSDNEAATFISQLNNMGFEQHPAGNRQFNTNSKNRVTAKAIFSGNVIVDNGVLYKHRVENMLALCMIVVDHEGFVYIFAKAVKSLETGEPLAQEFVVFNSNPEPLTRTTGASSNENKPTT